MDNKVLSFIGASSLEGKLAIAIKIKGISFTSITKTNEMHMLVLGQAHSLPGTYPIDVLTKSAYTHTHTHTHTVSVSIILYQRDTGNNINAHQLDLIQCIDLHTFRETLSIEKNKSLCTLIEILPLYIDHTNHCDFFKKAHTISYTTSTLYPVAGPSRPHSHFLIPWPLPHMHQRLWILVLGAPLPFPPQTSSPGI